MKGKFPRPAAVLLAALLSFVGRPGRAAGPYYFLHEITLGGTAGTPSLCLDPDARRLCVTHSTKIEIVDLEKEEVAATVSNVPPPRGFAFVPHRDLGYFTSSRDGSIRPLNLRTGAVGRPLKTVAGNAAIVYQPRRQTLYAFDTRTKSAMLFDGMSGRFDGKIALPGKPGFAAVDAETGMVYCTLPDRNAVAALDDTAHVARPWQIAPGKEPSGIAVDAEHHRVFVGCRNKFMIMTDTANGQVTSSVPVGTGANSVAYDPASRLVFCAGSDGTTTIAHEDSPEKLVVLQTLQTERNAHLIALDPKTHKIYLTTTDYEAPDDPAAGPPPKRPRPVPGTLKILVYGPAPP